MASCFHDEQDIESDLKIEVAREKDILEEGQELKYKNCDKNPEHRDFIPFADLISQHLPLEDKEKEMIDEVILKGTFPIPMKDFTSLNVRLEECNLEMLNIIKRSGSRVVRLVVTKRDAGTGLVVGQKLGTGFVIKLNKEYYIQTNNHVVKCDEEVKNCDVEFNYDFYDDMSNISISRGVKLAETCPDRDVTWFTFDPVPEFIEQLNFVDGGDMYPTIVITYRNNTIVKKKTHYHHKSSQYIYYTGIDINDEQIDMMRLKWSDDSISYMKSCYIRIQPIPSNIQDLTNIKIHVDEDDGNSRVISGDVVKLGGEYVIKISESISQDEVKKYKIVRNGVEISFGTRLYFKYFKSREFFSDSKGVDFEQKMKQFPTNVWLFDCHPKPRQVVRLQELMNNVTRTNKMCCIGHPHGGIKMVTFGIDLGKSVEKFDDKYQHIVQCQHVQPEEGRQYKEVTCLKYSCKTCPGSSGSIIFPLCKIPDVANGPAHFMGDKVFVISPDGELIENINMAWIE